MCYQMPALCVMYKMWSALTGESEVAPVASVHSVHTGALITLVTWHTLATWSCDQYPGCRDSYQTLGKPIIAPCTKQNITFTITLNTWCIPSNINFTYQCTLFS